MNDESDPKLLSVFGMFVIAVVMFFAISGCEEDKPVGSHEPPAFDIHHKEVIIGDAKWTTFGEPFYNDTLIRLVADNGVIREFPVDAVRVLWEKQQKAEKQ